MTTTADVVIIGGGIMGASLAFHLARAGLKALLLEKTFLCAGGTGKSTAIIRMHYENVPEAQMALASYRTYTNFDDVVGGDCGWTRTGVLWLAGQEHAERL